MNPTHITHKTAKALKEFLGENPPEPMELSYYERHSEQIVYCKKEFKERGGYYRYALHDLLSRPFCEAFMLKVNGVVIEWASPSLGVLLNNAYYSKGLLEVEKILMRMMNK